MNELFPPWTVYLCHACGWIQSEEEDNLACARCGEERAEIEQIEIVRAYPLLNVPPPVDSDEVPF